LLLLQKASTSIRQSSTMMTSDWKFLTQRDRYEHNKCDACHWRIQLYFKILSGRKDYTL
jgi:hypothetical protein